MVSISLQYAVQFKGYRLGKVWSVSRITLFECADAGEQRRKKYYESTLRNAKLVTNRDAKSTNINESANTTNYECVTFVWNRCSIWKSVIAKRLDEETSIIPRAEPPRKIVIDELYLAANRSPFQPKQIRRFLNRLRSSLVRARHEACSPGSHRFRARYPAANPYGLRVCNTRILDLPGVRVSVFIELMRTELGLESSNDPETSTSRNSTCIGAVFLTPRQTLWNTRVHFVFQYPTFFTVHNWSIQQFT